MSFTPMIQQYLEIKKQYQDAILFFRLGDFYEMFFEDAHLASRELEITLTGREGGKEKRVPMCGIPFHAADNYIARLIEKGYKVAICEQVEDPASARGIVRREVIRVITAGTVIEENLLKDKKNNYLVVIAPGDEGYGLAVSDISTGLFMVTQFGNSEAKSALLNELARLQPSEVVLPESFADNKKFVKMLSDTASPAVSSFREEAFQLDQAIAILAKNLLEVPDLSGLPLAASASGALLAFLLDTQKQEPKHLNQLIVYSTNQYMLLDATTRRNLELTISARGGSRRGTLLWVLDNTVTAMGGRLIKSWLEQPLQEIETIKARLEAVEEFTKEIFLRRSLHNHLKQIYDLERLASRISFGSANARDLVALKTSLAVLPEIKYLLAQSRSFLIKKLAGDIDSLEDICSLVETAIVEAPPFSVREGGLIKSGYHEEVDRLRSTSKNGKTMLAELEGRERSRTGIKSLKIGFNRVFGYYLEVTRTNLELVPDDYQRRQTLANAERFITPELKQLEDTILGAEDRLVQFEYQIFTTIREQIAGEISRIQQSAGAVARADVLLSLAEAAIKGRYTRPVVNQGERIIIRDGRHPVLEQVLKPGQFVPNDTLLGNSECSLSLITGPNMAGKSTYMRQVALIVLMAQAGSFVPAGSAEIGIVDRIFTRVGAFDDLSAGQSTFMVEMDECRTIVLEATKNSLIILDEVGRGTSTYDGISIARALAEYIHDRIRAKTLFSTHYHELTDLEQLPGIINLTIAVKEEGEDIIFLRKVLPGKADRSYGIHVAQLAGLPPAIISRAGKILKEMEIRQNCAEQTAAGSEFSTVSSERVNPEHPVLRELVALDLLNMTPLEALNKLYRLQQLARKEG
ncbi:MAG: DNA mismatch repair protein MutS [Peptococcaceae bacterium]|nr:MAG: DNA mismatch repair protein MutS [Peptococcaceae bacterium]